MSLVCMITGCSNRSGFGWLTAVELLERGHHVVATMRDVAGRNLDVAGELQDAGVEVIELDVTDDADASRVVADVLAAHARIDALVNNAAHVRHGALENTSDESLRAVLDANVLGPHRLIRAALPGMRERGSGVIVQVSSINGFSVAPLFGSYAASKHALEAYSETLASEVWGFGIRVVIVEPGAFLTGLHDRGDWEPGSDEGPYAALKHELWDSTLDAWVGTMAHPGLVARAIADAIEDPDTTLHLAVGKDAVTRRAELRPRAE